MNNSTRTKKGQFKRTNDRKNDMMNRSGAAKDMHGMGGLKKPADYFQKMLTVTEKAMTQIGTKRSEIAQRDVNNVVNLHSDFADIYMPDANFMDDPSGGDAFSDSGRIPLTYLVPMSQYRSGWAYRATFGTARDIYRNGYDLVELDADDQTKNKKIPEMYKWMDTVDFFSFRTQQLFRDRQTGLGIGVACYPGDTNESLGRELTNKKDRPTSLKAYSAYHLFPTNMLNYKLGDYDKSQWNFRGGIRSTLFHHSRVNLLETRPEPFHMRGLSVIEPIWAPAICYYNTMIFVLKSLAQVGTMTIGIQSAKEYPSEEEAKAYLGMLDLFRANKFYFLGKDAELVTQNMAGQIGRGIGEFLEFLREDISSSLIIPKNQLFGRSEGGGLDGAGALVSKEDYLSSLMADAGDITSEELKFLRGPCKFEKHLEGLTLRWRLDLHKTEMERLNEEAARMNMEMMQIQMKLEKKKARMDSMLLDAQMKEVKKDPKGFLDRMNTDVERDAEGGLENKPDESQKQLEDKSPKASKTKDFMKYYKDLKWNTDLPFKPRFVDAKD